MTSNYSTGLTTPTQESITQAYNKIASFIHKTPIHTSLHTNKKTNASLFFKCENFQKTGSFKVRGAINTVLNLNDKEKQQGVGTHSSGNHGQGVAYAAHLFQIPASIILPSNVSEVKKKAIINYGASIISCHPSLKKREQSLKQLVNETKVTYIPPYDHPNIISGQATASLELLQEQPDLDYLLIPVGGGGLLSGSALTCHYFFPHCKVIGCEPALANDAYLSFTTGVLHPPSPSYTIADGLRTCLGKLNFKIIQKHVSTIITVTEKEIIYALKWVWERLKVLIEPSAAVPLAAIFSKPALFKNKKVGLILTGGNIDSNTIATLFNNDSN